MLASMVAQAKASTIQIEIIHLQRLGNRTDPAGPVRQSRHENVTGIDRCRVSARGVMRHRLSNNPRSSDSRWCRQSGFCETLLRTQH